MDDKQSLVNSEIRKFLELQEERCLIYNVFNEAHKIYLASSDEKAFFRFSQIVKDVTKDFQRIALAIIGIEKLLREQYDEKDLSASIKAVQNFEQTKLRLTAELQIKMKEQKDAQSDEKEDEIAKLNKSIRQTVEGINDMIVRLKDEIDE